MTHISKDIRLVIHGASGRVGGALQGGLLERKWDLVGASSADCDLLNPDSIRSFYDSVASSGELIVILCSAVNRLRFEGDQSRKANLAMVENLLDGLDLSRVQRFVFLSTIDVYSTEALPLSEGSVLQPNSEYAESKLECEELLGERFSGGRDEMLLSLRLPGVYGMDWDEPSVVLSLTRKVADGEEILLEGGGRARRDFLYARDLGDVVDRLLRCMASGVFNVVSGVSLEIRSILEGIENGLSRKARAREVPDFSGRCFDLEFDNTKLRSVLGDIEFSSIESAMTNFLSRCRRSLS